MTLTAPFDILADWPGRTLTFEPLWRQEFSRQTNGVTRIKDFGSPLWQTTVSSRTLKRPELDYWKARMNRLRNGEETFYGYSMTRRYPIAYPRGSWPTGVLFSGTTGTVHSLGDDNKSLTIATLPVGFVLSVGDFIQIGTTDLYQVQEPATANGSGLTNTFEVFPNFWPGTTTGTAVSVKQAHCLMTLLPGTMSMPSDDSAIGKITFQAVEARS